MRASVRQLRDGSDFVARLTRDGRLRVVGAEYSLATGVVEFFDGLG